MNARIRFGLLMCLLTGCEDGINQKTTSDFTLNTGVSIIGVARCESSELPNGIVIKKDLNAYVVDIHGMFACETDQLQAYLTLPIDRRVTLVLRKKAKFAGFNSSCECKRSLAIRLEGRLESGNVLYVSHESEVLGHVAVP